MLPDKAIEMRGLSYIYPDGQCGLKDIDLVVHSGESVALIGPNGAGKSTLLLHLNGILRGNTAVRIQGLSVEDRNIREIRKKVGMVFQRPNPFPLSIFENVVFGQRVHGEGLKRSELEQIAEESLRSVLLWDDLKDKLQKSALKLSLEQKQRLCIARLIAVKSDIVLMDEPCSTLDPQATAKIEELMRELKEKYTIIIVTHNMQQAARVSDDTGFMLLGELVEFGRTDDIFTHPQDKRTEDYITGRYG